MNVHYALKYGSGKLQLRGLPENADMSVYGVSASATPGRDEVDMIGAALGAPIDSPPLGDIVRPGERVCIITSDNTRPMPTAEVLPTVIETLRERGVRRRDIFVVFALGIHRPQGEEERRRLLGSAVPPGVTAFDSDPADTVYLGRTAAGTPVHVFRPVAEADRIICLGNVEFHYFAGYSGGLKAILPGVCNADTVTHNHRMMTEPGARAGQLEGNPVREDIDSVFRLLPVDFIVNVALNGDGRIVHAAAGHPIAAHRDVCAYVDRANRRGPAGRAHLVLASAGGHPKDVNLYQTQKAIEFACQYAAPGAPVLCVGECSEGYGNETFTRWLRSCGSVEEVTRRLRSQFELGGHKAFALARRAGERSIGLASALSEETVRRAFLEPIPVADGDTCRVPASFLRRAQEAANGAKLRITILPEAASLLPEK